MKKPKNYYGYAFMDPEETYDTKYLNTKKGKKGLKKILKRNKKHQKHLKKYGWDKTETWNLDYSITMFILPRLKYFAKNIVSYPNDLTLKKWKKILNKMIYAFEEYSKDDWLGNKEKSKKINKGLDLFRKYFMDLWS